MAGSADTGSDRLRVGVMLITGAVFLMTVQEALFKVYSDTWSLWQVFTLRGLLAIPMLMAVSRYGGGQSRLWSDARRKWPALRSLFMTLMFVAMYASIPFLNLSTVAAGIYTAPVFVTLLSVFAIREPVRPLGWLAIALGFSGVLVILRPGTEAFSPWTLLPVMGGFFYALSNVITRARCQDVSLASLGLSLNVALLGTGLAFSILLLMYKPAAGLISDYGFLFSGWTQPDLAQWTVIVVLAVLVVVIAIALAGAYRSAPPAVVATFDYSYLIFATLWDVLFFSFTPTPGTIAGMAMIVVAGLLATGRRIST